MNEDNSESDNIVIPETVEEPMSNPKASFRDYSIGKKAIGCSTQQSYE